MEILVIKTKRYGLVIFGHDRLRHIFILDRGVKVCISTDGYTGGDWLTFGDGEFEGVCRRWHRKRLAVLRDALEGHIDAGLPVELVTYGMRPGHFWTKPGDAVPAIATMKIVSSAPEGAAKPFAPFS